MMENLDLEFNLYRIEEDKLMNGRIIDDLVR